MALDQTIDDYFGNDGSPSFSIDSPKGEASLIDFDFGILYAVNDNFRFGIHFQQPYIDIYWEFLNFNFYMDIGKEGCLDKIFIMFFVCVE